MGVLSRNFKPNFLGLLKFLNNMNWFIVFFSLINLSLCIYEDQIGKFDWRQTYVGRIKFAQFDTVSTAKKIIVATEENVLAALNLKTGQVVWRHVFESASAGNIQLLHVGDKITTVTGSNPYLVRGWDPATGVLMWEWSLILQNDERADYSEWWVQNNMLVHLLPAFGSHLEVTMYNLLTGGNRGATSKLPAIWSNDGCILTAPYYTCVSGDMGSQILLTLDVTSNAIQIISKPLSNYINLQQSIGGNLRPLDNSVVPGFIVDDKKVLLIRNNSFEVVGKELEDEIASATVVDGANGPVLMQTWTDDVKGFQLTAYSISTNSEVPEIHCSDSTLSIPEAEILAAMCTRHAREQHACRILVNGADDAVHLMQQGGRLLWSREEALANVVAAEFVDLPVSETDAAIESEFDQKEAAKVYSSVWSAFSRRLHSQFTQLQNVIKNLQGQGAPDQSTNALVRDYFNLHKIIVLITDAGKIFGMDNLSGEILWRRYEPGLDTESVVVYTRRSARHPPYDAYLTIVGKHEETGNGYVISLNPITGNLVGEQRMKLDVRILQCSLLHQADSEKLHALVLLDEDETVQVFPISATSLVENLYLYVADKHTGKVQGYALKYNGVSVEAQRTWSVQLGGSGPAQIVATATRSRLERVRSPGRALADRSVLYKYSNPNLVLFVVEKPDPTHKEVVTAVALDAVSGALIGASSHRRARALPLAVHADNCFAYLYRSEKHRRLEIATMELYEGKERWLEPGVAFSSFASDRAPAVERQAYILPASPTAATFTITERSLTDRHVLLGLTTGAVIEMPWAYLEARRGLGGGDEALLPYTPELPLPAEATLNYNRTVERVRGVLTAPAGLESTSLVLVTGLDLFYTRVAPSKTFDLLKDDFDYFLITVVLAALIVATYSTKYFASRKMLKLAWK
ncbi:ER membrane protein complex subunit 1 isoform X1 [Maniola jurtina]|uniref:ER membrane protein complex subunit 1 isoform X1 n=1 Tax=Maniola jurtina TaxID=191418 RepID=UPI001E688905|nr:ER membrane protein complex subunit 1 isoform X1 [Maniola jurtina]